MQGDIESHAKQLYLKALSLPESQVQAMLELECAGNAQLLQAVRALLGTSTEAATSVGPYKLIRRIGEGSYGIVWLAERSEPLRQRVAVKILKRGVDTEAVVARFEQERQALAIMNHPNIASVLDAGTTEDGLPYFVMEYVDGKRITTYCDEHNLPVSERLRIFMDVCDAVQHAHNKGVIHRDIKPSNILVETVDQRPVPKVIDFGVAKALDHTMASQTIFTEIGQIVGTLEYMSPEQAIPGNRDIDTRSDVYSLGVLLYELVAGKPPIDSETIRAMAWDAAQRLIREQSAPPPSTRIKSLDLDTADRIARARSVQPRDLANLLQRELEWIPLMALRKERERRYTSAAQLAEDIGRYLRGDPILAAPESRTYRVSKFFRKHRAAVLGTSIIFAALVSATFVSLRYARIADNERAATQRYATFLESDMLGVDPVIASPNLSIQFLLENSLPQIESRFPEDQRAQARLKATYGRAFANVGLPQKAEPLILAASRAGTTAFSEDELTQLQDVLTEVQYRQLASNEQLARIEAAIADSSLKHGTEDLRTLSLRQQRANTLKHMASDRWDEAMAEYQSVLSSRLLQLGVHHLDVLITRHNINMIHMMKARALAFTNECERTAKHLALQQALTDRAKITEDTAQSLGNDLHWQSLASLAEEVYLKDLVIQASSTPEDIADLVVQYRDVFTKLTACLGESHWRTLETEARYVNLLRRNGLNWLATDRLAGMVQRYRLVRTPEFPDTLVVSRWWIETMRDAQMPTEALAAVDDTIAQITQNTLRDNQTVRSRIVRILEIAVDISQKANLTEETLRYNQQLQRLKAMNAPGGKP